MQAPDKNRLSINTATVRQQWNLEQIIDGCARHNIRGISPWRDQVQALGLQQTAQRIRSNELFVSGYCRGGMFPGVDAQARRAADEDNRRAVDEALALNAACLVLVVGGLPGESKDLAGARSQVRDGLGRLLEYARNVGMPLAIEPLHPMYAADRACVNTLEQANDLCDELGDDGLGIAVDLYHTWWDPKFYAELERAGRKRILAFHLCDWLVPTRDLLNDRGMMGDGVIDIRAARLAVEALGFTGAHEVEIFSAHNWWQRDPDEVLETCKARHQSHC
ncbi:MULTISPECIES: sugar phosphate isomerase/epimerase family protein [unclassified Enterobacter]|uniref:sugar phosphate isomerase/epimerase family protein n=1 Tax=unclassified Enterobacter TaxID=2608935 RepID=UPI0008EDDC9A|nr:MULTISPECIES: sugar phosphate isomerase/epimerase [unclassified Enterobacter]SFR19186.1 Sugar phosphate isomerase/epimerase [Enterobacter sp. kpr-6]